MFIEDLKMNLQLFADQDPAAANDTNAGAGEGTGEGGGNASPDQSKNDNVNNDAQDKQEVFTKEMVDKMVQSETDKVRTKYVKELKTLQEQLEQLKLAQMNEKEKKAYEEQKRQKELEEKERELRQKELNLKSFEVITEQRLDPRLRPFILADTEEEIENRAKELKSIIDSLVNNALQERIKGLGREPHRTDESGSQLNPFAAKLAKWR